VAQLDPLPSLGHKLIVQNSLLFVIQRWAIPANVLCADCKRWIGGVPITSALIIQAMKNNELVQGVPYAIGVVANKQRFQQLSEREIAPLIHVLAIISAQEIRHRLLGNSSWLGTAIPVSLWLHALEEIGFIFIDQPLEFIITGG
jgi:hypothetical protein